MASSVNPDLVKERQNATFDIRKLTYYIDGGQDKTEQRQRLEKMVLQNKDLSGGPNYHYQTRPDKYGEGIRKAAAFFNVIKEMNLTSKEEDYYHILRAAFPNEEVPFGLNESMFIPTLEGQCSPEQAAKWVPMARRYEIIGTYAQTEMGHGTHIRKLETTSTYDPNTEEFVIHSPTLSSTKWWPGGLGKTSDHVVLMAQLITQGKSLGIQPFIVQIRDLETHQPKPGVTVGDIGPKFGYDTMDNGFLRFDHVRIPRNQMLMKNNEILADGTFVSKAKNKRLSYGTMVFIRAMISLGQAKYLGQACTIAVRYSCVRRQSELNPGAEEPQILDFQTQQYKLLPLVATAYAFLFAGQQMRNTYFTSNEEIMKGNVDLLPELHATTSCLKSFTSSIAMGGIEQCRLACGGHGFSQACGIPKIYVSATPACTYEGENTVLYLQTARYLAKAYDQAASGGKVTGLASYIHVPSNSRSPLGTSAGLHSLLAAFNYRAARLVEKAGSTYTALRAKQEQHIAWNNSTIDFVDAAAAHASVYVMEAFVKALIRIDNNAVKDVMMKLCQLYGCFELNKNHYVLTEFGYMSGSQIEMLRNTQKRLLSELRTNAVALVDAFDFSDHALGSCLGRYDGRVYETMYEWARANPLNETEVHPSFDKHIKPFRQQMKKSAKL